MPKNQRFKVEVTVQQSQADGPPLKVIVGGLVHVVEGTAEKVAAMLFEAEQHGNDGRARIHIMMQEDVKDTTAQEYVVCKVCRGVYRDQESVDLVKKSIQDGYAPCPRINCPGELELISESEGGE